MNFFKRKSELRVSQNWKNSAKSSSRSTLWLSMVINDQTSESNLIFQETSTNIEKVFKAHFDVLDDYLDAMGDWIKTELDYSKAMRTLSKRFEDMGARSPK